MCGWATDRSFYTDEHGRVYGPEHDELKPIPRYVASPEPLKSGIPLLTAASPKPLEASTESQK